MNLWILPVLLVLCCLHYGGCDKTSEKIYYNVLSHSMCFRRMNGTHQIGCTSARGGNVGILHYINTTDEVEWLTQNNKHKPYVVLMSAETFNKENVDRLREVDGLLSGMLVEFVNGSNVTGPIPDAFSPDSSCPNNEYGLYAEDDHYGNCDKFKWNPDGNALMFEDYGFPIVALYNHTEVEFLKQQCYIKFNQRLSETELRDFPLCAVQVKDAMDGAKDSPTCIRRSNLVLNLNPDEYCDPLADYTVFGFNRFLNNSETVPDESVIVAGARVDGFSMFDNLYPSADSSVSGIVTLLAAAQALTKFSQSEPDAKPILYLFFNGEAFDYIGSDRVVYEMGRQRFPYDLKDGAQGPAKIKLNNLNSFVEVSQVGLAEDDTYYSHTDPLTTDLDIKKKVDEMVQQLGTLAAGVGVTVEGAAADHPLPPASVQSFLKHQPLPAVVVADHDAEYKNRFYNSRFDRGRLMNMTYPDGMNSTERYDYITQAAERLCKLSTLTARMLYQLSTDSDPGTSISADCSTVTHLLYCMLVSAKCDLYTTVLDKQSNVDVLPVEPYPFYVGVSMSRNPITSLVRNLLAYFTGLPVNLTKDECEDKHQNDPYFHYQWMLGPIVNTTSGERQGLCVETTAFFSEAKSPAFFLKDYDWTSRQYSTWTESRWANDAFLVRAFLRPSPHSELLTLLLGIAMFVVSLPAVYFVERRAKLLFRSKNPLSNMADTDSH